MSKLSNFLTDILENIERQDQREKTKVSLVNVHHSQKSLLNRDLKTTLSFNEHLALNEKLQVLKELDKSVQQNLKDIAKQIKENNK